MSRPRAVTQLMARLGSGEIGLDDAAAQLPALLVPIRTRPGDGHTSDPPGLTPDSWDDVVAARATKVITPEQYAELRRQVTPPPMR